MQKHGGESANLFQNRFNHPQNRHIPRYSSEVLIRYHVNIASVRQCWKPTSCVILLSNHNAYVKRRIRQNDGGECTMYP